MRPEPGAAGCVFLWPPPPPRLSSWSSRSSPPPSVHCHRARRGRRNRVHRRRVHRLHRPSSSSSRSFCTSRLSPLVALSPSLSSGWAGGAGPRRASCAHRPQGAGHAFARASLAASSCKDPLCMCPLYVWRAMLPVPAMRMGARATDARARSAQGRVRRMLGAGRAGLLGCWARTPS